MNDERPITISGKTAVLHPWAHDRKELTIDYSLSLSLIRNALAHCEETSTPKLIGIEGRAGSRKTTLAKILAKSGHNTHLIEVFSFMSTPLSPLTDPSVTYIIDEAGLADQIPLVEAVLPLTRNGCTVVLLFQNVQDLNPALATEMKIFRLNRDRIHHLLVEL